MKKIINPNRAMIGMVMMVALVAVVGFMLAANANVLLVDEQGNIIGRAYTSCTDSDGGINFYEKGIVRLGSAVRTDFCYQNIYVREHYCINNRIGRKYYLCENGCQDGQCISDCVPEVCDGKDNDCDGIVDEGCGCVDDNNPYMITETFAGNIGDNNDWNNEYSLKNSDDSSIASHYSDACCNSHKACVWDNACYKAYGGTANTGYTNNKRILCWVPSSTGTGTWLDCDGAEAAHCGRVNDNCGYGMNAALVSGELSSHGGYAGGSADGIECCGDDSREFIVSKGVGPDRCCSNPNDCVDAGGVCRSGTETCDNEIDDDCDGNIDESCGTSSYVFIVKNTDTLLKIAPLAVKEDKIPVIVYTEGRAYEIILFLKALTKDVLVKIVYENNENFNSLETALTNKGIEHQKYLFNELLVHSFQLISFSDNERLKPYASAWAGKNNGLFLDSLSDVGKYIGNIPSGKIVYFGNNANTRSALYSYSSNIEQIPYVGNAEIKLTQGISSDKIVTVIPKITSDYSRLGVLYALYRNTALISVTGDINDAYTFDADFDKQLNLLRPYNNNQEFKYMTIVADRIEIPYSYPMPIEIINMSGHPVWWQFSADVLYADRNSAWSTTDIGDEDKYFIPEMGVGRITGYDLTSASILLNLGWLKENNLIQISKKAVYSSDWDIKWDENCSFPDGYCWDSKSIIENLNQMYGASNVDSYGDINFSNSLVNNPPLDLILSLAKNSEFVLLKGHGSAYAVTATNPTVTPDSILSKRPYKPSLWWLDACSTIKYGRHSNLDAALRSLSTNAYGSVDDLGTGSSLAYWTMPYFNQGHRIGDVIRFALQDSSDYFSTIYWLYSTINPNIPSQMEVIGDPLVSYGNNQPSYSVAESPGVSASLMKAEQIASQETVPLFSGMINLVSVPASTSNIRFNGDCGRMIIINNLAQLQKLANINGINYDEIRNLLRYSEGVILDANQNQISSLQVAAALIVESNCNLIFEK